MGLLCWLKGHDWKFSYNHGIPLGCSDEEWEKLKDITYPVHRCKRCGIEDSAPDTTAKSLRAEGWQD